MVVLSSAHRSASWVWVSSPASAVDSTQCARGEMPSSARPAVSSVDSAWLACASRNARSGQGSGDLLLPMWSGYWMFPQRDDLVTERVGRRGAGAPGPAFRWIRAPEYSGRRALAAGIAVA